MGEMTKRLLYLLQQAPYLDARAFEAIDALLVAAAFEQEVSLLFRGAGVLQLLSDQAPAGQRNLAKVLTSLDTYEVNRIYADAEDLTARRLTIDDCIISPQLLSKHEIGALINQQHLVLND